MNQRKRTIVNSKNIFVYCPPMNSTLWNMHPRVLINLEKKEKEICPYCSTEYILKRE